MDFTEKEKEEIFKRLAAGEGKRRIADIVGTTEWQIRKLFKEFSEQLIQEVEEKGPRRIFEQIKRDAQNPSIKIINPEGRMTVAIASDIHFPFEDKAAVHIFLQMVEDVQPEIVVLLGDIVDNYSVSKYTKNPLREFNLRYEIDHTKKFLRDLRNTLPDTQILFQPGNHSDRITKYLANTAPELACLEELRIENLLQLEKYNIEFVPGALKIGDLVYIHGEKISKHSAYAAKSNIEDMGISVISGHGHKMGMFIKTTWEKEYIGIDNGTMADRGQEYLGGKIPNWTSGTTVINYHNDTFWPEFLIIRDNKSVFRGKLYKGTNWETK